MAFDAFLKLDGIKGESNDSKHKGEIEIMSFSWGASQPQTGPDPGGGKATIQDFSFAARTDKATPLLMLRCATGEHIPQALLTCRKAGKTQLEFYKVTLTDVLVSGFQTGGHMPNMPTESFSLNFAKMMVSYYPTKADGTLGPPVTVEILNPG